MHGKWKFLLLTEADYTQNCLKVYIYCGLGQKMFSRHDQNDVVQVKNMIRL